MMCWGSAPNPAEDAALGTRKGAHPFEPVWEKEMHFVSHIGIPKGQCPLGGSRAVPLRCLRLRLNIQIFLKNLKKGIDIWKKMWYDRYRRKGTAV